jgi:hypothetical protein
MRQKNNLSAQKFCENSIQFDFTYNYSVLWDYLCAMHNQTLALTVYGMTCGHCSRAVKELIEEIEGTTEVHVSL